MSRGDRDRLPDILEASTAIGDHLTRGPLTDGLVFDAVGARLIEIGEAVKDVSTCSPSSHHPVAAGRGDA